MLDPGPLQTEILLYLLEAFIKFLHPWMPSRAHDALPAAGRADETLAAADLRTATLPSLQGGIQTEW